MGGRSSKQSVADHAKSSSSHPIPKNSDENHSSHGNKDRVFTDCTHSAKLLDNQRENKDDRVYLNSDNTPQALFSPRQSISFPTKTVDAFENSDLEHQKVIQTFENSKLEQEKKIHIFENQNLEQQKVLHTYEDSQFEPQKEILTFATSKFEQQKERHASENSNLEQQKVLHTFENSKFEPQKEMLTFATSKLEQQKQMHASENQNLEPQKENTHSPELRIRTSNREGQDGNDHRKDDYHKESGDDSYGGRISDYDGLIGSPSFREYCVKDYLKPDSNTCDEETIENKSKGDKYTSSNASEDSTASSKKRRKRRSIKQVISMGKPSAMRNLLNVSACYNPANFASRDKLVKPIGKNV